MPMSELRESESDSPRTLTEAAVRTLRHEVGDLLQTVYATSAILQDRLREGWELERRILVDMRARAEACKDLLDVTHDLLCPLTLNRAAVDLAELLAPLMASARARYPGIKIEQNGATLPSLSADAQRLAQVGRALLADACEAAAGRVRVTLEAASSGREIQWSVQRDGVGVSDDQLEDYFRGTAGYYEPGQMGMVLAGKIVALHGGRIHAENRPEGGLKVTVLLPVHQAGSH
jgi:signal transduction histidine kinase